MSIISDFWEELRFLPLPVTEEQVIAIARKYAKKAGKDFSQFEAWFETEKGRVLEMLNG